MDRQDPPPRLYIDLTEELEDPSVQIWHPTPPISPTTIRGLARDCGSPTPKRKENPVAGDRPSKRRQAISSSSGEEDVTLPDMEEVTSSGARLRRVCFTLNNYTEAEITHIQSFLMERARSAIYGKEIAPTTGTPHLQGAALFHKQVLFSTLKKHPGFRRASIFTMKGRPDQAFAYCRKEDPNPWECGDPVMPKPGKRNDLLSAVSAIREGKSLADLARSDDHTAAVVVKYHKGLTTLRSLLHSSRDEPPVVIWLHGPTGTCKTRTATEYGKLLFPSEPLWLSSDAGKWFDGYDGQSVAIVDDLRRDSFNFAFLLRLLDRYDMRVEYKGGMSPWIPKLIFVTAPHAPAGLYINAEDLTQVTRRVNGGVVDFTGFDPTGYTLTANPLYTHIVHGVPDHPLRRLLIQALGEQEERHQADSGIHSAEDEEGTNQGGHTSGSVSD